jgi:3-deoxy-manno-octulosonate cytidylyltransferase (CMP-KDO synthetase)
VQVVGVIPARYGATRFPGKALADLNGKPVIQWVIEGAQKCRSFSELIVATDHEQIATVAEDLGVPVVMTSSDLASGTDRIWAAINNFECDIVVNIQGDEPFVNAQWIEALVKPFADGEDIDMVTLGNQLQGIEELKSPSAVKVILDQFNNAIYFSRFPIPFSRAAEDFKKLGTQVLKHVGMYAYSKEFLGLIATSPQPIIEKCESLEQLRALYLGAKIRVVKIEGESIGIDTPEDLARAVAFLAKNSGR